MSFKKFSTAQDASNNDKPEGKSKDAPAVNQSATPSDKKPAEVASTPKS